MTDELVRITEDYVARLRRSMRGATRDVADESEREIRAHIEDALADRDAAARVAHRRVRRLEALLRLLPQSSSVTMLTKLQTRLTIEPHRLRNSADRALPDIR